jgi:hypothetical protein
MFLKPPDAVHCVMLSFLRPSSSFLLGTLLALAGSLCVRAETPTLLREAFQNWGQGKEELSFVQRTRDLNDDGSLKEERVERYDPSLPDNQRWKLLEVDGKPPTDSQRERIQGRRNRKPRKKANKPLAEYFDLENAKVIADGKDVVRYEVAVKPEAARLVALDKLSVGITVRKDTRTIDRVTAGLTEPMRIALGLAKVTDLDLDLRFDGEEDHGEKTRAADSPPSEADGTARVVMSKLGNRAEYTWGEFKRVSRYQANQVGDSTKSEPDSRGHEAEVARSAE